MKQLLNYIVPYRCLNCHRIISKGDTPLCIPCFHEIRFSHEKIDGENDTFQKLDYNKNLMGAGCLFLYKYGDAVQKLIHANKYYNQPQVGEFVAKLSLSLFTNLDIDLVCCVPSHRRTVLKRGYNQVHAFAKTLSDSLEIQFNPHIIKRKKRVSSQTHKNKLQRKTSLKNAFEVDEDLLKADTIILLDDVMTTGSTLNICVSELSKHSNAQIYIFTMARVI